MTFFLKATYPFFFLLSIFLPKNKKIWVFGHYASFSDNTRYFFEHAVKSNEFECYWLANNEKEFLEVSEITGNVVLKNSLKGYWLSSRAYITFICTGFGDVNRLLALNSNVINFWHGTPIKKVFQAALENNDVCFKKRVLLRIRKLVLSFLVWRTKYFYLSNTKESELILNSSNIVPEQVKIFGAPRFDCIKSTAKRDDRFLAWQRVFLYAPTWRENGFWNNIKYSSSDIDSLEHFLKKSNTLFLIKLHPLSDKSEMISLGLRCSEFIRFADEFDMNDINYLYTQADVLLTDVSSAIFDFMILDKKTLFFMPDLQNYLLKDRSIYNYFADELKSLAITNLKELVDNFENIENHVNSPVISEIAAEMRSYKNVNSLVLADIKNEFY
ncbi:CDP-glycerol glycerophosphotransferase family protein [Sinimarinibacterium sp. NLF-5-8]|uniref:CDP-glycerol glycerophosphotransferase family protein n=1 Tax=Sinimarinibacterium sp. NLF-5-8 TaxID=2698684 RepID=UPI00137C3435|nr:CDP-glycerol glycerophosphotransferase family protein [Sinimarinibacterium sp. NLF-5-8]QHS09406.1 CDP-glycerol glycerophosphotransferase family protein [Sinimarinibacterium sp. NLF-5-8]